MATFEIVFEGQTHATPLDSEVVLATLEDWLLRARAVPAAGALFDRIATHRGSGRAGPLQLGRDEARVLAEAFDASGFEDLRTLLARARAASAE
jgi:hypothetical protein